LTATLYISALVACVVGIILPYIVVVKESAHADHLAAQMVQMRDTRAVLCRTAAVRLGTGATAAALFEAAAYAPGCLRTVPDSVTSAINQTLTSAETPQVAVRAAMLDLRAAFAAAAADGWPLPPK
jgi:hypothetical protein